MSEQAKDRGRLISDTLLISAAPALAYGVAYFFEAGYLSRYTIPEFFISVSFERFFYALSIMVAGYAVLINFLDLLFVSLPIKIKKISIGRYSFLFILLVLVLIAVVGLVFKGFTWYFFIYLLMGLMAIFFIYIAPSFGKKSFNEYEKELDRIDDLDQERRRKSFTYRMVNHERWGGFYLLVTITCLAIIPSCKLLGAYVAFNEKSYLVTKIDMTDFALIRSYGEEIILINFQRKWKTLYSFDPDFGSQIIIKKISEQPLIFEHIKIITDEK